MFVRIPDTLLKGELDRSSHGAEISMLEIDLLIRRARIERRDPRPPIFVGRKRGARELRSGRWTVNWAGHRFAFKIGIRLF